MHDDKHHGQPAKGYETQDVSVKLVIASLAGLAVVTLACIGAARLIYKGFEIAHPRPVAQDASPLAGDRMLPPDPVLQAFPPAELREFEKQQQERLTQYGWVDQEKGVVHIPVGEAIKIVAARSGGTPVSASPEGTAHGQ
ncbi:MAG: hypothetical protein AMXMBFR84_43310 [Candidatus Hydrogenedentota bacterium]